MGSGTGQFKKSQIVLHIPIPKCCSCWNCEAPWEGEIKSSEFLSHFLDGPSYSESMVQISKPYLFSHNLDLTKEACPLVSLPEWDGLRWAHTLTCLPLSPESLSCACKVRLRGRSHHQLWVTVGSTKENRAPNLHEHHIMWPSWSRASGFSSPFWDSDLPRVTMPEGAAQTLFF